MPSMRTVAARAGADPRRGASRARRRAHRAPVGEHHDDRRALRRALAELVGQRVDDARPRRAHREPLERQFELGDLRLRRRNRGRALLDDLGARAVDELGEPVARARSGPRSRCP